MPAYPAGEVGAHEVAEQEIEDGAALVRRHALDGAGEVLVDEERLSSRLGMSARQGVADRFRRLGKAGFPVMSLEGCVFGP